MNHKATDWLTPPKPPEYGQSDLVPAVVFRLASSFRQLLLDRHSLNLNYCCTADGAKQSISH